MTLRALCLMTAVAALTSAACSQEPSTEILVVVDSDLPRGELTEVRVRAALAGATPAEFSAKTDQHTWPMSFAFLHGDGPLGPLHIEVQGWADGGVRVAREAEVHFVRGQVMLIRMDLFAACVNIMCSSGNTCTDRGCEATAEAATRLIPWDGGLGARPAWVGQFDMDGGPRLDGDVLATTSDARDAPPGGEGSDADTATPPPDGDLGFGSCAVFPGNDVWQADVRNMSVATQSQTYVASLGGTATKMSLAFGADRGVIWHSVYDGQATTEVELAKPNVKAMWPVPKAYPLADSPAARLVLVNRSKCMLYEALGCQKLPGGYLCETGGAAALNAAWVRQPGSVMAQDSALALLPALLRADEVREGQVDHALAVAAGPLQRGFVAPALNHLGGSATSTSLPPMGVRMRLRLDYPETNLSAAARAIVRAMKTHGVLVTHRENGLNLIGERNAGWAQVDLTGIDEITARDFEILAHGQINF